MRRDSSETKRKILTVCVRLFLEQGYKNTTVSQIVDEAGVARGSYLNLFPTKDRILLELTETMFGGQFGVARSIADSKLPPVYAYAVETAIQLTLTELNENLREIYIEAYSLPDTSEYIYLHTTAELKQIFGENFPDDTESDFYEMEIGTAGLMRSYMARKCDIHFPLERKLSRFLTAAMRVYRIPEAEQENVLAFIQSLDIKAIATEVMYKLFAMLEMKYDFKLSSGQRNGGNEMRKRILSLLLCCVMLIGLLPTAAFAEDSAEGPPVCSCETACTAESMNKECPVCGAENAIPQNCGQYIPVEDRTGENGSTERADDPNGPTELSAADQVQAMIDGLPNAEEIIEDNAEEVKAQLEAIDEAKEKLSDEEIDELDMTRYAEAAAALGALAAPMILANDSPDEQFFLKPGDTYYFDLSGEDIPGTANSGNSDGAVSLPDTSLHYVPFTYVGTIEAYKLTSATVTTEEYAQQNKYPHSLFVADYAVTHTVSWDDLNTKSLIFGKNYASGGVDYTLRAPSVGSKSTGSGESQRDHAVKAMNGTGYWTRTADISKTGIKCIRGDRILLLSAASIRAVSRVQLGPLLVLHLVHRFELRPYVGFRPVLEVLNPDTLGSDGTEGRYP